MTYVELGRLQSRGEAASAKKAESRGRNAVGAHVWGQNVRDYNRAVSLLIILDHGDPGAANGKARTIQSVNEVTFSATFGLKANARAAGLESFAIRAGRNLAEFVARGQPGFDVVRF